MIAPRIAKDQDSPGEEKSNFLQRLVNNPYIRRSKIKSGQNIYFAPVSLIPVFGVLADGLEFFGGHFVEVGEDEVDAALGF